jgi:hypothetical protein
MSVMDMNSRMAMAEKLSVPQLQQAIQSGSLPAYIGIPLIEQKNKERSQMAAAQGGQQKPPSVASQILQQAEQGVEQLPSNLPVSQDMAGGGIIAFAEGGDAEDFDVEAYREQQDEDEYADALRSFMAASEAAGEEGISSRRKKDKKYAAGGIANFYDGGDVEEDVSTFTGPEYEPVILPPRSSDSLEYGEAGSAGIYNPFMRGETGGRASLNYRSQRPRDRVAKGRELPQENLPLSALDFDANSPTLATIPVTPANASPDPKYIPTNTEDMDITRDTGVRGGALPTSGIDRLTAAKAVNLGAPRGNVAPTPMGAEQAVKPRSAYDDFLDEIRAGREDLKTQAQKDKYMALVSAGLGMMSGTSPNAFANIGQGAQAGIASYMSSGKQRAAEKAALNKNLLMGRRYQSMEDIANRTADINERRYAAIAAARGSGGDGKAEAQLDRQENAFTTRLRNAQATVLSALQAKFGKDGALIDPKGYAKAEQELTQKYVAPVMTMQERFLAKRYPDVFGDQAEAPVAPTPKSGFRIVQ